MSPPPDPEEFRQRILAPAKLGTIRAPRVDSEAKTNASLVQPFLTTLGYDIGNPDEVSPEHHADFSDKYQNKVDFAILHQGVPVITLESKRVGNAKKDDLGQLRSYFNALQTVKLGILTDGLKYDFYADSDKPNMMDDHAFLRVDFADIDRNGTIDDNTLSGIAAIRRGSFNPEDVGAEAKRKLLFESIVNTIKEFKVAPSDDFIRFILGCSAVGGKIAKITQKIVDGNREVVRSAMEAFVDQEALARFGYTPKDVVRTTPERQEPAATVAPAAAPEPVTEGFVPTEGEQNALAYAKSRCSISFRMIPCFTRCKRSSFAKPRRRSGYFMGSPTSVVCPFNTRD